MEHIIFEESFTLIVFPKELSDNSLDLKLIESKYSQISKIKHNNILFLYEFGEDKDCFWIRMEGINLISDNIITLADFAESKNWLFKEKFFAELLKQLLNAVSFLHKNDIIHRDLNPNNIYLSLNDKGKINIKVVNIGLTKLIGKEWLSKEYSSLTSFVDSFDFMPPERKKGVYFSSQSDLYVIGLITLKMLTGNKIGIHKASILNNNISSAWDVFILKALAPQLENRYENAEEMLIDLKKIQKTIIKRISQKVKKRKFNKNKSIKNEYPKKKKDVLIESLLKIKKIKIYSIIAFITFIGMLIAILLGWVVKTILNYIF